VYIILKLLFLRQIEFFYNGMENSANELRKPTATRAIAVGISEFGVVLKSPDLLVHHRYISFVLILIDQRETLLLLY